METLYRSFSARGTELIFTDIISSELIKYAANTFLATKVSFINEMADLCEKVGGDIEDVARGMGTDPRIGRAFLKPGPGYGGSCFPKDTLAMVNIGERALSPATIVEAVISVNRSRTHRMIAKVMRAAGNDLRGKRVALLGLTFKPDTDDVRDSVAVLMAELMAHAGARIVAYDPKGMEQARQVIGDAVEYVESADDALNEADLCVIATDWAEFADRAPSDYKARMRDPIIIDLRNLFPLDVMKESGFSYYSVGRPVVGEVNRVAHEEQRLRHTG
jgi:UDPglucose 6-dehydrogenase